MEERETLAFGTARPVSETRRFKPEGEEEQGAGGEGVRRLHPKICGPTGNTRTLLVTSRWMLRAYTGPPCRQRVRISYDTKTSHYFPLSLDQSAQSHPPASYSSPPRGARGHVTTIMPVLLLLSRSLPLVLLLVLLRNLLPSFVLFTSHPAVRISSASNYVSAKRVETKALLAGNRLINCNAMFALGRFHACFRISISFFFFFGN